MYHLLLFLGLSFFITGLLALVQIKNKNLKPSALYSLFLFGILLSVPFVLVEHLAFDMKYYLVIFAFIAIELVVITAERKWKYLHDLIHHNIKGLRIMSFFIISIGFTYSELAFYVLHGTHSLSELLVTLPIKSVFALFMHTVLTSSAALITATETLVEHIFLFFLYYLRLVFISISHFLYIFFIEHKATYLLIPFIALNVYLLFRHKHYLEHKAEALIT